LVDLVHDDSQNIDGGDLDMKKITLTLSLTVIGVLGGWYLTAEELAPSGTERDTSSFRTAEVNRRDIGSTVLATGVIRPKIGAEVRVGSRASGILERLDATVGEPVRKGQLLALLDSMPFSADYDEAEAALAIALAQQTYARSQYDRAHQLSATDAITATEFAEFERARAVAVAEVQRADAQLKSARIRLSYTRIMAPISGVVASVSTQVGEAVAASFAAPTFLTIIDLDRLEVWAYVDETDIGRVEVGQRARFTVDTYVDTEFTGTVSAIRPQAEIQDAVVNYVTVIQIDPGHGKTLRPEMTTNTKILLEGRTGAVAIPNGAVRRDNDGTFAYVLSADGTPVRRAITIGFQGRENTEVVDGVEEGEMVVLGSVDMATS
jgi:macrolide-specific efflux system membrane fusion protein